MTGKQEQEKETVAQAYKILKNVHTLLHEFYLGNKNHISFYTENNVRRFFANVNNEGLAYLRKNEFVVFQMLEKEYEGQTLLECKLSFTEKGFYWFLNLYNLKNNNESNTQSSS
jgi:hypothetical protein